MIRSHLADVQSGGARVAIESMTYEPFALLRELRAVGRFVRNHAGAWKGWSPTACELALDEIEPISNLISQLRARAEEQSRNALSHSAPQRPVVTAGWNL
jgi:hypothetical protein